MSSPSKRQWELDRKRCRGSASRFLRIIHPGLWTCQRKTVSACTIDIIVNAEVVSVLDQMQLRQERYPALVREAPDYCRSNPQRMRDDEFRVPGYPSGSGAVESAATTVVHHRLRRPRRGEERQNAQTLLAGLSELHGGRCDRTWHKTFSLS